MSRHVEEVSHWFQAGRIAPGRELEVLRAAGMVPASSDWRPFLGKLSLWLGTVALATAVIFFFAFNWDDLGRFARFGLVEAAIVVALLLCWPVDLDGVAGKALLTLLTLLVGALLALSGQTYQTGADTFELFAYWAALILPWVLASRFSPLWLVWLSLINIASTLYFATFTDGENLFWVLFAVNSLALIGWEVAHRAGLPWLRDSWPPRLLAMASAGAATGLMAWAIVDGGGNTRALAALAYLIWLAGFYIWYLQIRPDLFMLAAGLLSLIVVVVTFLSWHLPEGDGGQFLFIGLIAIGMSASGAIWLRSVAGEQRA